MSDYSFMKTGFSNLNTVDPRIEEFKENAYILMSLFSANATENAAKHAELCKRNGITKEDIIYGLKYEVFEFLKRPNINEELEKIREELEYSTEEEDDEDDYEDVIVPDKEIEPFMRFKMENINEVSNEDKEFLENMYKHSDNWDNWEPKTPLEVLLKNAINSSV